MFLSPVMLLGHIVRLEPLVEDHIDGLWKAGNHESIWQYMRYGMIRSEDQMRDWVFDLLTLKAKNTDFPFTVFHQETGQIIGATRYLDIQPDNRSLEIGGTWYSPSYQRTAVNTESKYLLLEHAFEVYNAIRVQFKTDLRNVRSQRAIERIGAKKEGVLRDHMVLTDGYIRSSVIYSILITEWPNVKDRLIELLNL
jgi:RimJ/RimL family protein N-acetyltransferase